MLSQFITEVLIKFFFFRKAFWAPLCVNIHELIRIQNQESRLFSKCWPINAKICPENLVILYVMLPQLIPEVLLKLFHNTFSALKGTNFSYTRKIKKKV